MTEATTIGDYKVEYDRMGKPTFTDANGNEVRYTDLKGNELALANDHFKLVSGQTQDGSAPNTLENLSSKSLSEQAQTLLNGGNTQEASPQLMDKINDFISDMDNMGKEKINGLKDKLKGFGKQIAQAIQKPITKNNNMINKNQSTR